MDAHLLRLDLLRMIHFNFPFAVHVSVTLHSDPRHASRGGESIRRFPIYVGYNRIHILFEFIQLPAQRLCNHTDGFGKPNVARQASVRFPRVEFVHGNADSLFFHNRGAERRQAVDSSGHDVIHSFAGSGPENDQQVHNQSRIYAGSQNGNAVCFGDFIQLFRKLRLLGLRKGHFFRGSDYVHFVFHDQF